MVIAGKFTSTARLTIGVFGMALVCLSGCSDPTLPHRKDLAIRITRSVAWVHPDIDSLPVEMQRMHLGAGRAAYTASTLEEFLASSPPLERGVFSLVQAFAKTSRKLESQFKSAIEEGRPDLNEEESEIAAECARNEFFLMEEIFRRIDYDSLAEVND
jgi:hypothetical protein